jgi:hypothetical protein
MSGDTPTKHLHQSLRNHDGARAAFDGHTHACPACSATFTPSCSLVLHVHHRPECRGLFTGAAAFVTHPPLRQPQSLPVSFSSGLDVAMPPNEEEFSVIVSGGPFDPIDEEEDDFGLATDVEDEVNNKRNLV